jgi:hypothetical protein
MAEVEAGSVAGRQAVSEMEKQVLLFRSLVITSLIAGFLSFLDPYLFDRWRSEETLNLVAWNGYEALLDFTPSFWWLWFLVLAAAQIGMLSFSPAARVGYAFLIAFGLASFAVTGVQVFTPFMGVVGGISCFTDGAILALAYFSELKTKFRYPTEL